MFNGFVDITQPPDNPKMALVELQLEKIRRYQQSKLPEARGSMLSFTKLTKSDFQEARHHNIVCNALEQVERGELNRLMIFMPPRHTKALALDTPIPTPFGWTTMEKLQVGDQVFSETGKLCSVIAKSQVWENRPTYKITTRTGENIVADANHQWAIRCCRKRNVFKIHTSEWMAAPRNDPRGYLTVKMDGLLLPEIDLLIPPYVLGLWLGDGSTYDARITIGDLDAEFILHEIESAGFVVGKVKSTTNSYFIRGLQPLLRKYDLLRNKHIPDVYLRASNEQRLELLRGLMDSDGSVHKGHHQLGFTSIKKSLAEQCQELVISLGTKCSLSVTDATLNGRYISKAYRASFYRGDCFKLQRKLQHSKDGERTPGQYLYSESSGKENTVCIQVDSPSSLFLAGRHMIPTHNSELVSRRFPAWYIGRNPYNQIIACSYNSDLATDFGRDVRNLVADPLYMEIFPGVKLSQDSKAADRWNTNKGGIYISAGVGSGITGRGAHIAVIDDPFKDRKEAESQTVRDNVWDWYRSTLYTRLMPGGAIILTLTRWHEDDLAGRLIRDMQQGGDKWQIITLPAIAEGPDVLGRAEGEALWPEWYPLQTLKQIQNVVGSYEWNALYQQRPSSAEGNIFKKEWWKYFREMPDKFKVKIHAWDTAFKDKTENDYSVCVSMGLHDGEVYLIDRFKAKLEFPDLKRAAQQMAYRDHVDAVVIEDKASGQSLIQELRRNSNLSVIPWKVDRDKVARAYACTPIIEAGRVRLPEWASWTEDYVNTLATFPMAEHDDDVDATTIGLTYLKNQLDGRTIDITPKLHFARTSTGWMGA